MPSTICLISLRSQHRSVGQCQHTDAAIVADAQHLWLLNGSRQARLIHMSADHHVLLCFCILWRNVRIQAARRLSTAWTGDGRLTLLGG